MKRIDKTLSAVYNGELWKRGDEKKIGELA